MSIKSFSNYTETSKALALAKKQGLERIDTGKFGKNGVITHVASDDGKTIKRLDKPIKVGEPAADKSKKSEPPKKDTKVKSFKGAPGKLSDREDSLSDGEIKQKALDLGYVKNSEHTAPGNPGSMANEIMSGEVSDILQSKPEMSDDDLTKVLYNTLKGTKLGQQIASKGTIATSRSKTTPEGLNSQLYAVMKASALSGKQKHNRMVKAIDTLSESGKVNKPMKIRNFYGTSVSLQKQIELIEKSEGPFYTNKGDEIPKDKLIFFIKNSGGGDNPCDTSTIAIDEKGRGIVTFHSDKMTTGDILSNTTPNSEAKGQIAMIDKLKISDSVKQKSSDIINQSITDLNKIEAAFDDAAIPVAQELKDKDISSLIDAIKSNKDIASRFIGGEKSVFQNKAGKYKFPTDISPDASEEEQLQAFFDYMGNEEKPKAPSKDMIKFISRIAKSQDIKTDFSSIRKRAIERQQKLLDELNSEQITIQGTKMGLGNYLEKKTLFKNLHLDIIDGKNAANDIFRFNGLLNVNHGGVVVEANELRKALGVNTTDELIMKVKIGLPDEGQTVTKSKEGVITGRNIFMYILDEEGNKVPFAYKTQRSKQGETGRTNNTIQYTKEMQERLVESSIKEKKTFKEISEEAELEELFGKLPFDIDLTPWMAKHKGKPKGVDTWKFDYAISSHPSPALGFLDKDVFTFKGQYKKAVKALVDYFKRLKGRMQHAKVKLLP